VYLSRGVARAAGGGAGRPPLVTGWGAPNRLKFTRCVQANWLTSRALANYSPFGAPKPGAHNFLFMNTSKKIIFKKYLYAYFGKAIHQAVHHQSVKDVFTDSRLTASFYGGWGGVHSTVWADWSYCTMHPPGDVYVVLVDADCRVQDDPYYITSVSDPNATWLFGINEHVEGL